MTTSSTSSTSGPITIGGIVSGLDTTSIINKLVAVEGNSQTLLTNEQTAAKASVSAYSALLGTVGNLVTQVTALADTSSWATTSATSSSSSVTATATGNLPSSLSFDVTQVAAAQSLISANTVSSTGATVASSGSLTLTKDDGTSSSIDVGNGSLSEVVAAINNANVGLTATAVQTSAGQYRLQVTAAQTGAASAFTLSGLDGFSGMNTLVAGQDAQISVGGTSANAYTVNSSSNTFANVASGLSFTVSKMETGVTVSSSVDPSSVATNIQSMVTNINNMLSTIATDTAWDPTTKTGGPLLGDSTVRSLQQSILSAVTAASTPGLSVTEDGQLSFDSAAFTTAFNANPTAVENAYGDTSTFTPASGVSGSASVVNEVATTAGGSYAINVTSNAKANTWQLVPPGTGIVGRTLQLTRGSTTVSYTTTSSDTVTSAAAAFNAKLAEAGFGVSATVDSNGTDIDLAAANKGTANDFTATIDGGGTATQTQAGADITGTINGVVATGVGNVLTVPTTSTNAAAGLSVAVNVSDADVSASGGAIGSVTFAPGLAQRLNQLFTNMSDSTNGQLVQAQNTANQQIKDLQTQIDAWTTRLNDYRDSLTQQFTAMETALATLKTQSTALSQYFSSSSSSSSSSTTSSASSSSS